MKQENRSMIDTLGEHLAEMRLIVEGAVSLFDQEQGRFTPLTTDLIGEALYTLRDHIRESQEVIINKEYDEAENEEEKL